MSEKAKTTTRDHGKDTPATPASHAINRPLERDDWLRLFVLAVIWGGSFYFIGVALPEIPPLTLVATRLVLAALVLQIVLRAMGMRLTRSAPALRAFALQGLLSNALPFSLLAWGQGQTSAALASILNATTPLWTVIIAHALTHDEKLTPARSAGLGVGFAGVAVMMGLTALAGLGNAVLGQAACLVATLSYGFAGVAGRRFRELGIPPLEVSAGQLAASSLMMAPLALVFDRPWTLPMPSFGAIAAVIGLALISTALAYVLFFRILASAGATASSLVTFLVPVSAIILAVAFLGESLHVNHILGMALIGGGLILIDGRLRGLATQGMRAIFRRVMS